MTENGNRGILYAFKRLFWELRDKWGRFDYLHYLLRELPGDFGVELRGYFYRRYFAACGSGLTIFPGIRFRNIHKMTVGDNVTLGVDNFFQAAGGLTIKDGTILGPGVKIWTANHRFDDPDRPIVDQGYTENPVSIGPHVWLGANVFIMPGVELPEGCIVSAGAVVGAKKYPPFTILAGNPARVMGNRRRAEQAPAPTGDESGATE